MKNSNGQKTLFDYLPKIKISTLKAKIPSKIVSKEEVINKCIDCKKECGKYYRCWNCKEKYDDRFLSNDEKKQKISDSIYRMTVKTDGKEMADFIYNRGIYDNEYNKNLSNKK